VTGEEIEVPPAGLPFQEHANIDGTTVVYETIDELPPNGYWGDKIVTFDLTTQKLFTVAATLDYYMDYPDISGDTVVWRQITTDMLVGPSGYDIMGFDLSNGMPFTISDRLGDEGLPRVDGDLVVWDWEGDIYAYRLSTGETITVTEAPGEQERPAVDGERVVWRDIRHGRWDVYLKDLATGVEERITEPYYCGAGWPALGDETVAWACDPRRMTHFTWLPVTCANP
jgi:beta propeller repeat protein